MTIFIKNIHSSIFIGALIVLGLLGCDQSKNSSEVLVKPTEVKESKLLQVKSVDVSDAWIRALPGKNTAAYFKITNHSVANRIMGASSTVVKEVQIHETTSEEGLMSMRRLLYVDINESENISFEPGGKHLMLLGLKQPLKVGDKVRIHLSLSSGNDVSFDADVRSSGNHHTNKHRH